MPAATEAPPVPDSYVRLVTSASFNSVRLALERVFPRVLDPGSGERLLGENEANDEEQGERRSPGEIRFRSHVWRGDVSIEARRESLWVRTPVQFTIAARGAGFPAVSCGTEQNPERGNIGCLTRIGWADDWGIEALSAQIPTVFVRLCKPTPPTVDFTALTNRTIEERLAARYSVRVDSLFKIWRGPRPIMDDAWTAILQPLELPVRGAYLDWDPQGALAEPPVASGDSVIIDVSFTVRPRLISEAALKNPGREATHLPAPRVRIARDEILIPYDFEIPCDTLAARVTGALHRTVEGATGLQVTSARVRGGGDRIALTLGLSGRIDGTVHFVGTLHYDPELLVLEAPDLAPSAETSRALRGLTAAEREAVLELVGPARRALRVGLRDDVSTWASAITRAFNRPVTDRMTIQGGINRRELAGIYGGPDAVGLRLIAGGRAHLVATE
jgi:hypothetical protein